MFKITDWSDAEDTENDKHLDFDGPSKRKISDNKAEKNKQGGSKKPNLKSGKSHSSSCNISDNGKKAVMSKLAIPNVRKQIDACFNSPSLTQPLMDASPIAEDELESVKKVKTKKKRRKIEKSVEDCKKNIFDRKRQKYA